MAINEVLAALADDTRRKILLKLQEGKISAGDLATELNMTPQALSYHLSRLKKADLIYETRYKNYGNTAQFGKKSQPEFLPQFKVPKMEEYCMYFPFLELRKWGKKAAENRRRNCAVLPYIYYELNLTILDETILWISNLRGGSI